jgi:L-seryl-tRNA(Ser) seleniumtransferase
VRVHPSNFAVVGFAERPTTREVAELAHGHGLLLIEDAGSGALSDHAEIDASLAGEPVLAQCIRDGADLVTASADKLCGGPQAGLVAGRAELVATLRRHPLMRAVRPDRMALAALGATLAAHLRGDAASEVPVQRMLRLRADALSAIASGLAERLREQGVPAGVAASQSAAGGGSLPGTSLATTCVVLPGPTGRLAAALRAQQPPVIARAEHGRVWLDPRTVLPEEQEMLLGSVAAAWRAVHGRGGGSEADPASAALSNP